MEKNKEGKSANTLDETVQEEKRQCDAVQHTRTFLPCQTLSALAPLKCETFLDGKGVFSYIDI